jgi:creatine kinase
VDISPSNRLFISEAEIILKLYTGIKLLLEKENSEIPPQLDAPSSPVAPSSPAAATAPTSAPLTFNKSLVTDIVLNHPENRAARHLLMLANEGALKSLPADQVTRLLRCVKTGLDNHDSGLGCYAMAPSDYDQLAFFFDRVCNDYHNNPEGSKVHRTNWSLEGTEGVPEDGVLDMRNLGLTEPLSMRVRVGRNLDSFPLPGAMSKVDRIKFEEMMLGAFDSLVKNETYGGSVFSMTPHADWKAVTGIAENPNLISAEKYQELVDAHVMFKDMDADPYLKSAGIASDWPCGRGCYQSADGGFIIWFGEEDQLRIMCMGKGFVLNEIFDRLNTALQLVESIEGIAFATSEKYGYVTSCPSNLGTGMRASVHLRVPNLTADGTEAKAKAVATPLGLSVRGTGGEHTPIGADGTVDISPSNRLFISEAEIILKLYTGIKLLLEKERNEVVVDSSDTLVGNSETPPAPQLGKDAVAAIKIQSLHRGNETRNKLFPKAPVKKKMPSKKGSFVMDSPKGETPAGASRRILAMASGLEVADETDSDDDDSEDDEGEEKDGSPKPPKVRPPADTALFRGSLPKQRVEISRLYKSPWKTRYLTVYLDTLEYGKYNTYGHLNQRKGSPLPLNHLMRVVCTDDEKGRAGSSSTSSSQPSLLTLSTQADENSPPRLSIFTEDPKDKARSKKFPGLLALLRDLERTHKRLALERSVEAGLVDAVAREHRSDVHTWLRATQPLAPDLFKLMDTNNDGTVSDSELAAAAKLLKRGGGGVRELLLPELAVALAATPPLLLKISQDQAQWRVDTTAKLSALLADFSGGPDTADLPTLQQALNDALSTFLHGDELSLLVAGGEGVSTGGGSGGGVGGGSDGDDNGEASLLLVDKTKKRIKRLEAESALAQKMDAAFAADERKLLMACVRTVGDLKEAGAAGAAGAPDDEVYPLPKALEDRGGKCSERIMAMVEAQQAWREGTQDKLELSLKGHDYEVARDALDLASKGETLYGDLVTLAKKVKKSCACMTEPACAKNRKRTLIPHTPLHSQIEFPPLFTYPLLLLLLIFF